MKKLVRILLVIIVLFAVLYFASPSYLRHAIMHGNPDIEDYQFFHNRTIGAGKAQPWKIAADVNNFKMPDSLTKIIESYQPIAYLVIQNEEIIFEKYWEGFNENSLSNSFSAAKSIVSLLMGIAIDEGKIESVDDKVGDYLPAYKKGRNKELTIRELLTMSSGLNWDEAYSSPFSMTTKAYYGSDIRELINGLEVVETPGKEFDYLSGNTEVLAMVVQAATGQTISDYTSEKIWKHIGAVNDALWCLDSEDGMEKAYCCFNSNARDFARFGQLILNDGKWNGRQIISDDYIYNATTPATYLIDKEDRELVDFYGYQWWIIHYKGYVIPYMRGILGQYVYVIPGKNAVVVRLGHDRSHEYKDHHTLDIYTYLDAAFTILDSRAVEE
jgi:CubicO group peptidase (beta-lactamase class C family)